MFNINSPMISATAVKYSLIDLQASLETFNFKAFNEF